MEEMLRVFQNTLLKWFGEEAGLTRETGTTQYPILGGGEGRAELLECGNNPGLFFAAFCTL